MDRSDIALVLGRAVAGDQDAFKQWLRYTTPLVYQLSLRILGSPQEAEDAVQDTYMRAWRGLGSIRNHAKSVEWVCRIARNVANARYRQRRRRAMLSLDLPSDGGVGPVLERLAAGQPNPEEVVASAQEAAVLHEAIQALNGKHRTVLLLRELDGLSHEEIAVALGCSVGTVYSRLHRAKQNLARKLRRIGREP